MRTKGIIIVELLICCIIGNIGGWFIHSEYVKRYKSDWRQIENRQVKQKVEKFVNMVVQKNGRWLVASEKDILKNQK